MGLIVSLVVGGIIGWLASVAMRPDRRQAAGPDIALLGLVNLVRRGGLR